MDFIEGLLYMMWRGIAIGVIISAPMGPVGILCVQRTLEKGRTTGCRAAQETRDRAVVTG